MLSINTDDYGRIRLCEKSNFTSNAIDYDKSIFKTNCFEYKYNEFETYYNDDYVSPREEFEEFQTKQGIIGRAIDKLKTVISLFTMLGFKNSNEIEYILDQYDNEEILEYEAREAVQKYKKSHTFLKECILNFAALFTMVITFFILKLFEVDTVHTFISVCTLSGLVRYALEKLEALTNSVLKNYKITSTFIEQAAA